MDILDARDTVNQVESGLKLALVIVAGIGGALGLIALIGASMAKSAMAAQEKPCETC